MLSPIGAVVELYGPDPGSARWDVAEWDDTATGWDQEGWRDVTGLAMGAEVEWGADRQLGVLSVTSAGRWSVRSYDPLRLLDPSNVASPFFAALHPGNRVRIRYGGLVIRQGWLDTITYSLADRTGQWRASDGIPLMANSRVVLAAYTPPTTLRALARSLIARQGLPMTVEDDPPEGDPTIGPKPPDTDLSVWDYLILASTDVLHALWLDADNVVRFRSYGNPRDLGLTIGGLDDTGALAGIPLEDLEPESSLDGTYNLVTAPDTAAGNPVKTASNAESVQRYGERRLDRDRITPGAQAWVQNVVADRAEASLDYNPRTLRLRDTADLQALVTAGMVDTVRLLVDSADPPVEVAAALIGVTLRVDPGSGWSADVLCYVPSDTWESGYTPPPIPPDPTPPTTTRVTRTYAATKDSRALRSSSGQYLGSGTEGQLPVGAWQGTRNRAFVDFASIPWTDVVKVVSATLRVTTSSQVNIGFGSSPKVELRRITQSWSEGSASSPTAGNALVYPGPATTTTGAKQTAVSGSQGARVGLDCTAIVRAWAPASAGGSGGTKRGIALLSPAEDSTSYTTEFLSRETGTSGSRPVLELVLDVLA